MRTFLLRKIYKHFEHLTDKRKNRGRNYPLMEMIFVALCATICDCNSWVDVERFGKAKLSWFRKHLPFENGIPSHDTFCYVFARLDTLEFYAALQEWMADIVQTLHGQTVAFDGKELRGSHDKAAGKSALHSVSAWVCGMKMCIGLKSVDDKSNEIPAVQQLIDMLDLQGAVVTADAMHCQTETAQKIIDKQADYILTVKGNQKKLRHELLETIMQAFEADDAAMRHEKKTETNRGCQEVREVSVMPVPKDNPIFRRWAGLKTIGCVYRSRMRHEKLEESTEYFITSLECKVREIGSRMRQHWSIETAQHQVLDVTFTEDSSRIRKGNNAEITSVFRRLGLNMLQRDTTIKDNIRGKRKRCSWCERTLEQLIAHFSAN